MIDDEDTCLVCGRQNVNIEPDHWHAPVIIRDGARGQYLAPTFVLDALSLLDRPGTDVAVFAAAWLDTMGNLATLLEADALQEVLDAAGDLEGDLYNAGYVMDWNDGYIIWQVDREAVAS